MSDGELRGKVAVVTGGATGIGLAASLAFARAGAAVAVNYSKNAEAASAAVKEIGKLGVGAVAIRADVSNDGEVRAMLARVAQELAGGGSSMAYAASKAALTTLTMSLARALAPSIRVNAVAPGLIPTGFGGWTDVHWTATSARTPIQRLPTADETAAAIFYLATTGGLTGQTIVMDGGLLALGPMESAAPR